MLDRQGVADVLVISVRSVDHLMSEDETFPEPRMVGRLPRWSYESIRNWVESPPPAPVPGTTSKTPSYKRPAHGKAQTGASRVH